MSNKSARCCESDGKSISRQSFNKLKKKKKERKKRVTTGTIVEQFQRHYRHSSAVSPPLFAASFRARTHHARQHHLNDAPWSGLYSPMKKTEERSNGCRVSSYPMRIIERPRHRCLKKYIWIIETRPQRRSLGRSDQCSFSLVIRVEVSSSLLLSFSFSFLSSVFVSCICSRISLTVALCRYCFYSGALMLPLSFRFQSF